MNDTVNGQPRPEPEPDRGLRQMLTWVFIALVLVVLLAFVVVELTLRSVNLR
jgi:uncharacterized membrane protein YjfL (UPF0719 family)